ncbi:hypothetical protein HDU82_008622 [Entophlyctis luteolus]|nr:hypothetical protein HDU82_008622 [Entophlyctis luteolus]
MFVDPVCLQDDGNAVTYSSTDETPIWSSKTNLITGYESFKLNFTSVKLIVGSQSNNAFVISFSNGYNLCLQDDANLVVYSGSGWSNPVWASDTSRKTATTATTSAFLSSTVVSNSLMTTTITATTRTTSTTTSSTITTTDANGNESSPNLFAIAAGSIAVALVLVFSAATIFCYWRHKRSASYRTIQSVSPPAPTVLYSDLPLAEAHAGNATSSLSAPPVPAASRNMEYISGLHEQSPILPKIVGTLDITQAEKWTCLQAAEWVRANGGGNAGAAKIVELKYAGSHLMSMSVEELVAVIPVDTVKEREVLQQALTSLQSGLPAYSGL